MRDQSASGFEESRGGGKKPRVVAAQSEPDADHVAHNDFADLLNAGAALEAVRAESKRLAALLSSPIASERLSAAVGLGAVGDGACVPALAEALYDEDRDVAEAAETALGTIWLRSGTDEAVECLVRGLGRLDAEDCAGASRAFTRAIEHDPSYAEAHVQRGIALLLSPCDPPTPAVVRAALDDFERAAALAPEHFMAYAGAGNCLLSLGDLERAAASHRRAVAINPNLECSMEALAMIRRRLPR